MRKDNNRAARTRINSAPQINSWPPKLEAPKPTRRKRGSFIKPILLDPEFITIDEAADFWRCSRRKVERKLQAKVIPKFKDGHRTLLRIRDVRAHARKMRQK